MVGSFSAPLLIGPFSAMIGHVFLLLHLAIGVQARHLTSALHRRTAAAAAQVALHRAAHRQHVFSFYRLL